MVGFGDVFSRLDRLRQLAGLLALLCVAAVLAWAPARPAAAHAQLVSSTPADGAVLAAMPSELEFTYNEDINPAFAQIVIRDSSGAAMSASSPRVTGPKVSVTVADPNPPAGKVSAAFRVTSKDGHPIAGQISFTVKGQATSGAAPAATVAPAASNGATAASPVRSTPMASAPEDSVSIYILTGAGAVGLMLLGGLVLWWERRKA